ncbi:hypothetical protein [Dinghuibacter silviterrae]|uniref:Uncharacterized protein n=1 Tax=Dinghuibacter silviterrae TaxID=1539049 RepID=A0A4R8DX79_9BACT|nr:hypothetical protein [Dinghuibacter silviterrae]TDX02145.1 hypothetical protein EDB95_3195 [Dinghuibacter silviterrae]
MKNAKYIALIASGLILTFGCKKSLNSSVDLTKGAKAGFVTNAGWQTPTIWGRITRFDIGSGNGSDCLLAYDCWSDQVSLTQVTGANSTTIMMSYSGFNLVGGGNVPTNDWWSDVTDQFAEFGGCHVIPLDVNKTGHEDHILVYFPGRGWWWLLSYAGNGLWNNEGSGMSGIGGYDLAGGTFTDKIVAYDYGDGYKDALICYRPGNQFFWVLVNENAGATSSSNHANWVAVVKSSGGVGGYDLKGMYDQIVPVSINSPGNMDIVCYRPGLSFVWWETHSAYSTGWSTVYSTRSGLANNSFNELGDRMTPVNISSSGTPGYNADVYTMGWRPGDGIFYVDNYQYVPAYGFVEGWEPSGGLNYPMTHNPYSPSVTYEGDHILTFSPNGQGNSSILFYSNGTGAPSQIYEWNPGSETYTQVY